MNCLQIGVRKSKIIRGRVVNISLEITEQIGDVDKRVASVGAAAVMETDARNTDFHQRGHPPLELWKRTVDSVQRFDCLAGCFCKINLNAVHLRLSCFIQGQSDYVVPPGQYGYGHHPGVLGCEVEYEVPSTACELRCATWPSKNVMFVLPLAWR